MRKILFALMVMLLTLALAACAMPAAPAPASEPAAEEAVAEEPAAEEEAEEMAEEDASEEETADEGVEEEAESDEMAEEDASEEEAADEGAEEEAESEEMAEEDASEEEAADDGAAEAAIYTVDAAASTVGWFGAKAVGGSHTGTVNIAEGEISVAGDQLESGSITIDMTSIDTPDSNRLLGHLKSDDFFGVETHPEASLVLNSAEATGTEGQYEVTADLTIKGITNEITFMADVSLGDGSMTADATIVFDRSLYDVQYGSGSFFDNLGDDLINDEVEMTVSLMATN